VNRLVPPCLEFINVLDLLDFGMDCPSESSWLEHSLDCNGTYTLISCVGRADGRLIYDSFKLYCGLPTTGGAKK
jgi:hypothetical protein